MLWRIHWARKLHATVPVRPMTTGWRPRARKRPERVRAREREGAALLGGQRLGEDEEAVEEVQAVEPRGDEVRQAQPVVAEGAAERGAEDEAEAEDGADEAEARRALLGGRDVGDVRGGGREARAGDAGDDAPDEEPPERGRETAQEVAGRRAEQRDEDDRPPPEPVGQPAEDRREEELHRRVQRDEQAEEVRRGPEVVAEEARDEARRDGDEQPDAQRVEEHW